MIKINAAWFRPTERGRFAGIFGFMINLGRFGIFKLGPALLGRLRIPRAVARFRRCTGGGCFGCRPCIARIVAIVIHLS